jgi:hypothetical protein
MHLEESGRELLATGEHCKLERCRCGVFHLSVGPITLRLTGDMVRDLAGSLAGTLSGTLSAFPLASRLARGDA